MNLVPPMLVSRLHDHHKHLNKVQAISQLYDFDSVSITRSKIPNKSYSAQTEKYITGIFLIEKNSELHDGNDEKCFKSI